MQRIERYGVIALVFLLVTIVAVSLWGEQKKTDGFFSFLKRDSKSAQVDRLLADASQERASAEVEAPRRDGMHGGLPLSESLDSASPHAFGGPAAAPEDFNEFKVDPTRGFVPQEDLARDIPVVQVERLPVQGAAAAPATDVRPVAPPAARDYRIRSGDTLSEISQRELGTKNRWRELLDANPGLDPARLHVGNSIRIPAGQPQLETAKVIAPEPKPELKPSPAAKHPTAAGRTYAVRPGDTLSQIAQRELGTQARWRELLELNPGLDPARLKEGQKLVLPAGSAPASNSVARAEPVKPAASGSRSKVR